MRIKFCKLYTGPQNTMPINSNIVRTMSGNLRNKLFKYAVHFHFSKDEVVLKY